MKDGTRELTNNQWLLKADADKLPATYEDLVTLLTGAGLPFGRTLLSDGWTIEPDPLNKANLLKDVTAGLYGLTSTAMVDDALKLAAPKMLLQSYTTAGTYTWTAPDRNGDGTPYEIFAIVVGGGGSGGAVCIWSSSFVAGSATGGGSGFPRFIKMTVTPGNTYTVVVGAGGTNVTAVLDYYNAYAIGNSGGTSSFDGKTASGGDGGKAYASDVDYNVGGANGGQPSDSARFNAVGGIYALPCGGRTPFMTGDNGAFTPTVGNLNMCINPVTDEVLLAAGGSTQGANSTDLSAAKQVAPFALHNGYIAGESINTYNQVGQPVCVAPTLPGAGGGACCNCGNVQDITNRATSAKGADGGIFIYSL